MDSRAVSTSAHVAPDSHRDIGFAGGVVAILIILFLPIPAMLVDVGLALSIAFSVLILMVALWIQRPLDFSAFPTVLLIATMLRLSLNIASTRLILSDGSQGEAAAGYVIGGFSSFVMGGDFVIGLIVFTILITVNFLVITKGATRIAEVGARFTLDAIPGKQMAIDADLSAGLIDDKEAHKRRQELEEESSFFGSMDGASKFVRGDAIAGLIITAVNIVGGIIIGVTRQDMDLAAAADVFTRLSVGDGLVSQVPALVVSLAAGLLVSKGGNRGSADKAVFDQLSGYPRALLMCASLMFVLAVIPALPILPFALLGILFVMLGQLIPKRREQERSREIAEQTALSEQSQETERTSIKATLKTAEIELRLGRQLAAKYITSHAELSHRVFKMRRKFASQLGYVVPEIRLVDEPSLPPKRYEILIHGTVAASQELRLGDVMVICGDGPRPDVPLEEGKEPAYGMRGVWVSEHLSGEVERQGFKPVDATSILLTHVSEIVRTNLSQLFSYKDMRTLLEQLDVEYQRLLEEICPAHITYSGLQAVMKLLLAERVSIRNLQLILEAIAEIAPHARRPEQIVAHVRTCISQQICADVARDGKLMIVRLGNRWDLAFHKSLRRDPKGDITEFDIEPQQVEEFAKDASAVIRKHMDEGKTFAIVTVPDVRPYVRMIVERMFPNLAVLSHLEIAQGVETEVLGSLS